MRHGRYALGRALVLGGGGMLAQALARRLRALGVTFEDPPREELDLVDSTALAAAMERLRPEVVFNCAAFTDVDGCESREDHALEVNGRAVGRLAESVARHHGLLVHVSSDYVFDGLATRPYREDAACAPRSAYGRSKLLGERLALAESSSLVVRASWLFGPGGHNFVATMRQKASSGEDLKVVDDQVGLPTYTGFLAHALCELACIARSGGLKTPAVLHYGNGPAVTWFELTRAILEVWRLSCRLEPVSTEAFRRPAPRPAYSVLDTTCTERLLGRAIEGWRDGLVAYRRFEEGLA